MIDYQKTRIWYPDVVRLFNHPDLEFKQYYNKKTDELEDKLLAKHGPLEFWIYREKTFWVKGSLHKYYNFLNSIYAPNQWNDKLKDKGYNGNRFTYQNFIEVMDQIEHRFGLDFNYSSLHHVEFGANAEHDLNSRRLLDSIVFHNGNFFDTERGKDKYIRRTEKNYYDIKVYYKSLQYGELKEMVRFEIKVKKMKYLENIGIKSLNDLRSVDYWYRLKEDLLQCWDKVFLVDYQIKEENLCRIDQLRIKDYRLEFFWSSIKSNHRDRHKKRYEAIESTKSVNTKQSFRNSLETSLNDLIDCVKIDTLSTRLNITHLPILNTHYGLVG